jgi:Fic family protein
MLLSGRKPRTKDEQMIINNYQVMQKLDTLKDVRLSEGMLLDIQLNITRDTLEDPSEGGRFRKDEDEIVVSDRLTGETVFVPPKERMMREELKKLIAYANAEDKENDFVHPVIKATILHFWLAYLHPFPDGNGRTARAIFYWYLIKRGYWLFRYLAVSRVIKTSRKSYDEAFLHSEHDENDLTYFVLFVTKSVCRAVEDLLTYYQKKAAEAEQYQRIASRSSDLNERQVALLSFFRRHPEQVTDIKTHQSKHGIVYETARRDLMGLVEKGLVVEMSRRKKKLYLPHMARIDKLFEK